MDKDLKKQAAEAIRNLKTENQELKEKLEVLNSSREMLLGLYKEGSIQAEEFVNLTEELENKGKEDLQIIKKAMELRVSSDFVFGSLSDRLQDDGLLDPLTRMLIDDY
jgi:hypothetical protein